MKQFNSQQTYTQASNPLLSCDLEKLCRRPASDARTVIEETGTNMLHLIFGFLEFTKVKIRRSRCWHRCEAVPVTLEKGAIDQNSRAYQYSIRHWGRHSRESDATCEARRTILQSCIILRRRIRRYLLLKNSESCSKKKWRVTSQLTMSFLSFGKLAIWHALDSKRWPQLLSHSLLEEIFTGRSGKDGTFFSSDVKIDNHPKSDRRWFSTQIRLSIVLSST